MEVILWSLVVIAASTALAQALRYVIRRVFRDHVFKILDECLAAMQCSIAILECGVVSSCFGPWSWITITSVFIFGAVKHLTFIKGKYIANPLSFIDHYYMAGKRCLFSPFFIVWNISAQLVGSLLAHPLSRLFWGKTYSQHHNRIMLMECKTSLEVPFAQGLLVEFFTTLVAWMSDSVTPLKWKPPVRSAVSISLVLTFLNTSGSWMNPAMATAHTFNCEGHEDHWEHFITYWLGPFMAVILFNEMKELFATIKEKRQNSVKFVEQSTINSNRLNAQETKGDDSVDTAMKFQERRKDNHHFNDKSVQEKNDDLPNTKYHRSPGGSLRQRMSSLGPG